MAFGILVPQTKDRIWAHSSESAESFTGHRRNSPFLSCWILGKTDKQLQFSMTSMMEKNSMETIEGTPVKDNVDK